MLGRLQHRNATLNKEVTKLKAKLEIEAIQYEMEVNVSKKKSQLIVFVAMFWSNYYGACNGHLSYKRLP